MKKKLSLRVRIFLSFSVLIAAILLLTAAFINVITRNSSTENARETSNREIALITNNLDSKISHIEDYAISVAIDSRVISTLKAYPAPPNDIPTKNEVKGILNEAVSTIMGLNRNVSLWDIVSLDGEFYSVGVGNSIKIQAALPEDYFQSLPDNFGVQIDGPFLVGNFFSSELKPYFIVTKRVVDLNNRESLGYIFFAIQEQSFASIFEDNMPVSQTSNYYILDEDNYIISSSIKEYITKPALSVFPLSEQDLSRLYRSKSLIVSDHRVRIVYSLSENLANTVNWKVIGEISLESLLAEQDNVSQMITIIGVAAFLFSFLIAFWISFSILKPIQNLAHAMREFTEENMNGIENRSVPGEMEILYSGFNQLMAKVNHLLNQVYTEERQKSEYQFRLIQAQIKPHFLYNTLETIKSLIELNMNGTAIQCLNAMATFYRLSLSSGSEIISIGDEVRLSQQYMYIQKLRYIEHLDYSFQIPDQFTHFFIPKMTLQPILENAIYHGVKEKEQKGIVSVVLREEGEHLLFCVTDNGAGMDDDALQALLADISSGKEDPLSTSRGGSNSFGLSSIHRRLRILYGQSYGVTVKSQLGEFTAVTVTLPKVRFLIESRNETRKNANEEENTNHRG